MSIIEEQSKIVKHKLIWEIIKYRRTNKGNRWLSHFWPNQNECKKFFTPTFAYLNYIGPSDQAGGHYHKNKKEYFCPLGDFKLLIGDVKNKKTEVIKMSLGTKKYYSFYYIPPMVPHAVKNCTDKFQALVVLTNKKDIYGKTYDFKF
ncbi:WxcM-like domain-containing protein [Patescibacteria group bacterium]|nr:WxcM-like domain-containing protein [Patescibacteria group bacterium]MBU0963463.1 WxcM-like domain-containing protein [Patescibacteria group bacterium]